MKVKVINKNTNQQFDCEEIIIDGFKYYINSSNKDFKTNELSVYKKWKLGIVTNVNEDILEFEGEFIDESNLYKIICCNNPNIDIPKVVDEVERLAEKLRQTKYVDGSITTWTKNDWQSCWKEGFTEGYKKCQETHHFSEEDMIDFYEWCDTSEEAAIFWRKNRVDPDMSGNYWKKIRENREKLLQIWKEQRTKIIYYE